MIKKPVVGVFAEVNDELFTSVRGAYIHAIEKAGGIPLLVPFVESDEVLGEIISRCNGIFLTGGVDISPDRYGEEIKPTCGERQLNRDTLEFKAFDIAFKTEKTMLAVCRGAQLVNVALGGSLYQDLPTEHSSSISHRQTEGICEYSHEVNIAEGTPLYALLGAERIRANSFHHQAVKRLGDGLEVMAQADDGVVEALYYKGDQYLMAYQWHPERLFDRDAHHRKIFEDFIRKCEG